MLPALLAVLSSSATATPPTVLWASSPVGPNQTALLQGHGLDRLRSLELLPVGRTATARPAQGIVTANSGLALHLTLPSELPWPAAYRVSLPGSAAQLVMLNAPRVTWLQGDRGDSSSPGGWVRAFGECLVLTPPNAPGATVRATQALRQAIDRQEMVRVRELSAALAQLGSDSAGTTGVRLRLAPAEGAAIVLEATNASQFEAFFELPAGLAAADYEISIGASHLGEAFEPVEWFQSKHRPRATSWPVKGLHRTLSRVRVAVTGAPDEPIGLDYIRGTPRNATKAINSALSKCREVANPDGCEVFFPRGMYFYAGALQVPRRTWLVGEAQSLVSLFFYEQDNGTTLGRPAAGGAPGCKAHKYGGQGPWDSFCHDGYIWSAEREPWGLSELTVYVTKFHHSVIHVSNNNGFSMSNVRVRAVAFFGLSVVEAAPEQLGGFHSRYAPYGFRDIGEVILIENSTNFQLVDSDLYGLGHVVVLNNCSHGLIARNTFYGGHAPGLVNVDHLICERNYMTSSWEGSSFYFKYGWHIYHGYNTEQHNYVGDREGFTYDNPGKSMMARVQHNMADQVQLDLAPFGCDPAHPVTPDDGCTGWSGFTDVGNLSQGSVDGQQHVMIQLNGTGAPQYRFILGMRSPGLFVLDKPFAPGTAGPGSFVSVDVVKAQNIHVGNFHSDTGHFQFFNGALDTVVGYNVGERMGGFFTYGQWHPPSPFFHNGWVLSPSYFMQFLGNEIIEGNAVKNYVGGAAMLSSKLYRERSPPPPPNSSSWRWQFNGGSVGVLTATVGIPFQTIPSTAFLTFRSNQVHNSGGIFVGSTHETTDTDPVAPALGYHMIVEDNHVRDSPACVSINEHFTYITERHNKCPT